MIRPLYRKHLKIQVNHCTIDNRIYCEYNIVKINIQTVDAEITAMMPLQRARDAESRVRNKLSNGPLRVQSNGISQSILQRAGIR